MFVTVKQSTRLLACWACFFKGENQKRIRVFARDNMHESYPAIKIN